MQKTSLTGVWLATLLSVALIGCSSSKEDAPASAGASGSGAAATDTAPRGKASASAYVGPDFFLAVVVHPQRMATSPLVAPLLKMDMVAGRLKELGIDPAQIEQMTLLISAPPGDSPGEPVPCFVVRFAQSVDPKQLLAKLQSGMAPGASELEEAECAGEKCWRLLGGGPTPMLAHAPNSRTIVLAVESEMPKLLAAPEGKGPLADRLRQASMDGDVLLAVEMLPAFRKQVELGLAENRRSAPPVMAPFLDIPLLLKGGTLALNLTGGTNLLTAGLEAKDASDAAELESLVKQALDMGKQQVAELQPQIPPQMKQALGLADQALKGTTLAKVSNSVRVTMKRPASMNEAVTQLSAMLVGAAGEARGAAQRVESNNNLKQIALALQNHHDVYRSLPARAICDKAGKPLLSWRVKILPFVEGAHLYDQFKLDEPWDSEHNKKFISQMPQVYRKPGGQAGPGKTVYLGPCGEGMLFAGTKARSFAEILDGTSNTIAVLEVDDSQAVIWTKPDDWNPPSAQPLAGLGQAQPGGFQVAFVDGSVQFISKTIAPKLFRAMLTVAGGENISGTGPASDVKQAVPAPPER